MRGGRGGKFSISRVLKVNSRTIQDIRFEKVNRRSEFRVGRGGFGKKVQKRLMFFLRDYRWK